MTMPFVVTAGDLADGKEKNLQSPLRVRATAALDSPACTMEGTFAVSAAPGELGEVKVRCGSRTLFEGRVDRQRLVCSGGGMLLHLEARSAGAALLDNEAVPCALANVRLSTVFDLFAKPYGFTLYNPGSAGMLASYVVHKGMSEWEALAGYTRRMYGLTPIVRGGQVAVDRPRSTGLLTLGSRGDHPFSRLEHSRIPYHMLSKVVLRDALGRYGTAVSNSAAPYYGVRRKRYVIPPGEFADNPALDANQRIRRSMLESRLVTAKLPGVVAVEPGQETAVLHQGLNLHNLLAGKVTHSLEEEGAFTTLELVDSVYYL